MEPYALDLEAVRSFCDRSGIAHHVDESLGQIAIPRASDPAWALRIVPRPERGMLTVAYPLPGRMPPERLPAIVEAVGLLNSRTFMGAWVLNGDSGELYFRQTVLTEGAWFDDRALGQLLRLVALTVEQAVGRLDRVAQGERASIVLEPDAT